MPNPLFCITYYIKPKNLFHNVYCVCVRAIFVMWQTETASDIHPIYFFFHSLQSSYLPHNLESLRLFSLCRRLSYLLFEHHRHVATFFIFSSLSVHSLSSLSISLSLPLVVLLFCSLYRFHPFTRVFRWYATDNDRWWWKWSSSWIATLPPLIWGQSA